MSTTYSWRVKLDRAQLRLEEFSALAGEDKIQDLRVVEESTAEGEIDSRIYPTVSPDLDLASAILGEAFYSLRAGMDQIMAALVPPARRDDVHFPVLLTDPAIDKKAADLWTRRVKGASAAARSVLEQVQPYHWLTDPKAPSPLAHLHPIARVHKWNIIDKHREPLVTEGVIQVVEDYSYEPMRGMRIQPEPHGGPEDMGLRVGGIYRTFALPLEQNLRGRMLLAVEDHIQPPPGTVDPGVRRALPAAGSIQYVIDYVRDEVYTPLEPHLYV